MGYGGYEVWVYSWDRFKGHTLPSDEDPVSLHTHVVLMRLLVSALCPLWPMTHAEPPVCFYPFSHGETGDFLGAQA